MFLALVMLASTGVMLQAAMMDSADFPYQHNGTLDANPYFTTSGMTDAGGGILDFTPGSLINGTPTFTAQSANLIASGYTIEARVKVTAHGGTGFGLYAGQGADLGWLDVRTDTTYSVYPTSTELASGPNNDDFHVFRIVHAPGASTYSLYKDGLFLSAAGGLFGPYTLVELYFATPGGSGGEGQLDYVRWTPGAYEPVRTTDSTTWPYQQNGVLGFNPALPPGGMTDAGGGILDFAPGSLINGTAAFAAQSANLIANGFTIEARVKVTADGSPLGFALYAANGADLGWFDVRTSTTYSQYPLTEWSGGPNNDGFHVFRMVHGPGAAAYSVWKDGELPPLTSTGGFFGPYATVELYFGTVSGSGPAGQLDYVRWTPGTFPIIPAQGTVVIVQ